MPATAIGRPPLRYYGSKWRLAPRITSLFPEHSLYVDLMGGGGSVLLQKRPSDKEVYNDADGQVVNFFRVLRDRPDDLIRALALTPWSREEYDLSYQPVPGFVTQRVTVYGLAVDGEPVPLINTDHNNKGSHPAKPGWVELEQARRTYVRLVQGMNGATSLSNNRVRGWRVNRRGDDQRYAPDDMDNVDGLYAVARRLSGVQIEHDDYAAVAKRYDGFGHLMYFDPPYLQDTRTQKQFYEHDWEPNDHEQAAWLLRQLTAAVIVSHYPCELYEQLYERHGWARVDLSRARTNSGGIRGEALYLSPAAQAAPVAMTLWDLSEEEL